MAESNTTCPHCGYKHEMATHLTSDASPSPGDISLCIECGEWCAFTDDLSLRKANDEEHLRIGLDPTTRALREAWTMIRKEKDVGEKRRRAAAGHKPEGPTMSYSGSEVKGLAQELLRVMYPYIERGMAIEVAGLVMAVTASDHLRINIGDEAAKSLLMGTLEKRMAKPVEFWGGSRSSSFPVGSKGPMSEPEGSA